MSILRSAWATRRGAGRRGGRGIGLEGDARDEGGLEAVREEGGGRREGGGGAGEGDAGRGAIAASSNSGKDGPLKTRGHSRTEAHSMQCSGRRGVLAIVQMGNAVGGVCIWSCRRKRERGEVEESGKAGSAPPSIREEAFSESEGIRLELGGKVRSRRVAHRALVAVTDRRQDDLGLALEALGPTVDHRLERLLALVLVDHADERRIHPPPGLDRVEPGDDEVEGPVEGLGVVLNLGEVAEIGTPIEGGGCARAHRGEREREREKVGGAGRMKRQ